MASELLFKLARNMKPEKFLQHAPDLKAPVESCAQVGLAVQFHASKQLLTAVDPAALVAPSALCVDVLQPPSTLSPVLRVAQVAVKVTRCAVHVGGRYRKLRRDISNSPWIPGKCVTSVQEELERVVLPGLRADLCKFMSAGAPSCL